MHLARNPRWKRVFSNATGYGHPVKRWLREQNPYIRGLVSTVLFAIVDLAILALLGDFRLVQWLMTTVIFGLLFTWWLVRQARGKAGATES